MKTLLLLSFASLSASAFAGTITITSGQGSYTANDGTVIVFKAKPTTTNCYCKINNTYRRGYDLVSQYELTLKNPKSTNLVDADAVLDHMNTRDECLKAAANGIDCQKSE